MVYRDGSCSSCPPCLWRKTMIMNNSKRKEMAIAVVLDRIINSAKRKQEVAPDSLYALAQAFALLDGNEDE